MDMNQVKLTFKQLADSAVRAAAETEAQKEALETLFERLGLDKKEDKDRIKQIKQAAMLYKKAAVQAYLGKSGNFLQEVEDLFTMAIDIAKEAEQ